MKLKIAQQRNSRQSGTLKQGAKEKEGALYSAD